MREMVTTTRVSWKKESTIELVDHGLLEELGTQKVFFLGKGTVG